MQVTVNVVGSTSDTADDGSIIISVVSGNEPLEYSINGGGAFQADPVFENLPVGTYTIVVQDASNCIFFESVEISVSTATNDFSFGHSVEFFPNPTDGVIQVEINGLDDTFYLFYEVYDMLGKQIHRGNINAFNGVITGKISLVAFPEGTYLVKFDHPELKALHKVVKLE